MESSYGTPPNFILELRYARIKTDVLQLVNKLRLADTVHELEPQADMDSIAVKLGIPLHGLGRLLNACVALGILVKQTTVDNKATYHTTAGTREWLLKSSERSMAGMITFDEVVCSQRNFKLEEALQLGKDRINGKRHIFQFGDNDHNIAELMAEGMAGMAVSCIPLARAHDLSKYKTVVDVGGGVGVFATELKRVYPDMDVSILEIPQMIKQAHIYWKKRGVQPNFTFVSGDMFEGPIPESDLYILGHILHDWGDDQGKKILDNIGKVMKPGGAILILDKVFPELPSASTVLESLRDLHMLCVPLPAEERTLSQFREMLEEVGFYIAEYKENSGCVMYDSILATKKQ